MTTPRRSGGRQKGARNRRTIVCEIANERYSVIENGKKTSRTTFELVLLAIRKQALDGKNASAVDEYYRLLNRLIPQVDDSKFGVMLSPETLTPKEWMALAEEYNKTAQPPPGYDWAEDDFDKSD